MNIPSFKSYSTSNNLSGHTHTQTDTKMNFESHKRTLSMKDLVHSVVLWLLFFTILKFYSFVPRECECDIPSVMIPTKTSWEFVLFVNSLMCSLMSCIKWIKCSPFISGICSATFYEEKWNNIKIRVGQNEKKRTKCWYILL